MKSFLLPMAETSGLAAMMRAAVMLAHTTEGYLEGVYVRAEPSVVLASDDTGATTPALIESFEREDAQRGERLRLVFERSMDDADLVPGVWRWREISPEPMGLGGYGRLFDVIVVGRPGRDADSPSMSTLEAALFDTGRAILIVPPAPPETLGERVVIAWNGSSETARTVALGLPLLTRAERVVVVTVDSGKVPGPTGADLARYLERAGVPAEAVDVAAGRRSAGEAMLDEAETRGADLLIKGGYTRSRLRQTIFGGPTSHILANARLPVFMAH